MYKIFLFCFLLLSPMLLYSQSTNKDSLRLLILNDKEDTVKVNHLNELSYLYRNSKPDSTILLSQQAIELCKELAGSSTVKIWPGYSNALGHLAIGYRLSGEFVKAKEYYFKALRMDEKLGYLFGKGKRMIGISNVYENLADYPKALEYGFKGLQVNESIKNPRAIALSYAVIGNIYFSQKDYEKSMEYILKSLETFEEIKDYNNLVGTYSKMAAIYDEQKNHEDALKYLKKALKIAEDNRLLQLAAETMSNIGFHYLRQEKFDEALIYYTKGLEKGQELKMNTGISNEYNYIGYIYMIQNSYADAEKNLLEGLKISRSIGALKNELQIENNLAELYQRWDKPELALTHFKSAGKLKDSIYNNENTQKIMNIEFDKKEQEQLAEQERKDSMTEAERKKQQLILIFVALAALLLFFFSIFIFRSLKTRNKQNRIIEAQKHKVEEKQKEILDSIEYALRIQTAILPPQKSITENLKQTFILYQPKDIVAGDFYWMETVNDFVLFAACDCTGHGVPGAMVSMVCHNALNRAVREFGLLKPAEILDKAALLVVENFAKSEENIKDGMDISLCCYHPKTKKLQWAGANNALWLIQEGTLTEIKADKQPIGMNENPHSFTHHEFGLNPDDTIYLFTDGYADQFGGESGNKKLTKKRFKDLVLSIQEKPMDEQGILLRDFINDYRNEVEQIDDILVMGIKV